MVWQAYIDESFDERGTFVLAGCIASATSWAAFSEEWRQLLPRFGVLDASGLYTFKMREMASLDERMARVVAFYRVIEKNVRILVSVKIDSTELERAKSRIFAPDLTIRWHELHPYLIAYRLLLDSLLAARPTLEDIIPHGERIDFYFDERSEKGLICSLWNDYVAGRSPDLRDFYGATPRFGDDNKLLPLQAADFWAWWVRRFYASGTPQDALDLNFGTFQRAPDTDILVLDIWADEEHLIFNFVRMIRHYFGPETQIIIRP
jgi:hypothetical protein